MQKNIVYILTDQHRADMLGCNNDKIVKTPNIDNLAAEGINFPNAFTPTSICTPARASLFCGLFPLSHTICSNPENSIRGHAPMNIPDDIPTLEDVLPDYELFYFGKWHVEETLLPVDHGFSGHNFAGYGFPGCGLYKNLVFDEGPGENNCYKDWLGRQKYEMPFVSEAYFGENPNLQCQELCGRISGPAEASIPHFIVDKAVNALKNRPSAPGNKPFFMQLNFWGPHSPSIVPEPYYSMYDRKSIPVYPGFNDDLKDKPSHYSHIAGMWGVKDIPWTKWQEIIACYYGYITLIDDCIGIFIDHLKATGEYDNTIIVFTADHGDAMGAHHLIEKGEFMFDETYKIPFVVRHPDNSAPGSVCEDFVYLHDLFPTAAEIATGRRPDTRGQSESLLPQFTGRQGRFKRDFVYGEFTGHFARFPQRMYRTRDWKLVFNACSRGELYDLKNDPYELRNLIDDVMHKDVKRKLIDALIEYMEKLDDPQAEWFRRIALFY